MTDPWKPDDSYLESARRNQRRAVGELNSLRTTIDETRRVLAASRSLLEQMAEREDPQPPG